MASTPESERAIQIMRHVREQMGSYAECWLSDLLVTSTKNDVDPGLMRLFRQSDKRIVPLSSADAPVQLKRRFEGVNDDIDLDDFAEEPELVYYIAPVSVVKDRLNVLGYTIETARQAFVEGLNGERAQTDRWLRAREDAEPSETRDSLLGIYRAEKKILSQLSADVWLATLKEILTEGVDIPGDDSTSRVRMAEMPVLNWYDGPLKGTLLGYMLSREWFGFPGPDTTAALRLTLEVYPEAEDLIYDVTDLVWTESAARDDDFVAYTAEVSIEEMQSMAKTILLTEGPSDASILESSLELLYPHLADYYSFMEFDAMRVGGGAGNLANLVKAFAGAGVVNKTIALFDNDTAALSALRGLANLDLPEHLAVLTLPVLCDDEGLCRVQWTGYDTALRQYQGQVLDKAGIQSRFQEKLRAARVDGEALDGAEWSGLRAIFACVFAAFHDLDRQRILEDTQAYFAEE